jgi:hypothetical protein
MNRYCLVLLLFCGLNTYAQKFQMGKVSVKELEEKVHPKDSSAVGAVLYNKGKTYFIYRKEDGFSVVHEFEMRIKIYKKEGLDLANYEVPYYVGYKTLNPEYLEVKEATTYNLVDGKIEKTKAGSGGTLKERVNENWKTATIVFPDVKVGSVIEFKYTLKSQNLHVFPNFKFQRDIPVNYAEYSTEIPLNYTYKPILNGLFPVKVENKVEEASQSFDNEHGQTSSLQYKKLVSVYSGSDIPALKEEEYVDNLNNYRASVDHELEMIRFPDTPDKNLAQTWEGLVKTIYEDKDFGNQFTDFKFLEPDVSRLVKGIDGKQQRLEAIFKFVQSTMHWNGKFGIFTDKGVKQAFADKQGNDAEVNFILIMMLNLAGVNTSPVLISTVKNGVAVLPTQSAFNYIIGAADIDGKRVLLDAINQNTVPGLIPPYAQNWSGRIVNRNGGSEEIQMAPTTVSRQSNTVAVELDKSGKIQGKLRLQKTDYEALTFREKYRGIDRDTYLEGLEKRLNQVSISDYSIDNENTPGEPILESLSFTSNNEVDIIGDKMYLEPMLFFTLRQNPFLNEERLLPIFFGYPVQKRILLSIAIPEGYTVESIPQSINLSTGQGVASFKFSAVASKDTIVVNAVYEVDQMLVAAEFYPILREFFTKLLAKENEKIVLKKIGQ